MIVLKHWNEWGDLVYEQPYQDWEEAQADKKAIRASIRGKRNHEIRLIQKHGIDIVYNLKWCVYDHTADELHTCDSKETAIMVARGLDKEHIVTVGKINCEDDGTPFRFTTDHSMVDGRIHDVIKDWRETSA